MVDYGKASAASTKAKGKADDDNDEDDQPHSVDEAVTSIKRVIKGMRSGMDRDEAITKLEEAVAGMLEERRETEPAKEKPKASATSSV